jgi:hypothetical protein
MNLWGSDRVFLTLGLVTMFIVFGVFAKKAHAPMFFTVGDGSTLHHNEGDYSPQPL